VTTEGGLDISRERERVTRATATLRDAGIRVSLFIDPTIEAVRLSRELGADAVELHTGEYAHHPDDLSRLVSLQTAANEGRAIGIDVHAGHGLTLKNVGPVAAIPEIEELNIGHSIVSRSVFVGLDEAVREIRRAMDSARR
jgi:pyridoxine 5-phosphate synthase